MSFEILFMRGEISYPQLENFVGLDPQAGFVDDLKAKRDSISFDVKDGVANIPIHGPIMTRVPLSFIYYDIEATGIWNLRDKIEAALADDRVKKIHFDVDSPGGSTLGLKEVGDLIKNSSKPTSAFTSGGVFSAAYWLTSQVNTFIMSASAQAGSLGSYIAVSDFSKMFEQAGIKKNVISSGGVKGIGVFGSEITDTQKAFLQRKVDEATDDFKEAVNQGRGSKIDNISSLFNGEWWSAKQSVKLGLADSISNGSINMTVKKTEEQAPNGRAKLC